MPMEMQYIWYGVIILAVLFFLRRIWMNRSLAQYEASQLDAVMKTGKAILLDVRTDAERRAGAIRGSLHIPLQLLNVRIAELEEHKGKEIICYCHSGSRSVSAALLLLRSGYNAANLRGGIAEWNFFNR